MKKSHQVLKDAMEAVGVKTVASKLNLSQVLLYKWCQDSYADKLTTAKGAKNPLDRIRLIYEATGDQEIVNWICQMADGYFVENKYTEILKNKESVFSATHQIIKEFSETLDVISSSYNDDQKISREEAQQIRKEWEDLKRIGEGFVKACEEGHYHK